MIDPQPLPTPVDTPDLNDLPQAIERLREAIQRGGDAQLLDIFERLEARLIEADHLRQIDLALNQAIDTDKANQITLDWACRLTGAGIGYLGLVEHDPPRIRTVNAFGLDLGDTHPLQLHTLYPAALDVIDSGQTRHVTHASGAGTLIVPAARGQTVVALVILDSAQAFTAAQQELVERIIGRATVALENARLHAEVQTADFAKGEFVGVVAHDLKVPMASILGYAELTTMEGDLNPRQVEFLIRIRETVRRMEVLVSDLADLNRLESGHFFMEPAPMVIQDIVQAVRDSLHTQLAARRHTLIEDLSPDLPEIHADYYRLLQVLTNLTSNAIKYTPDGGTITLRVRPVDNGVEFSVQDNGIGLSPESIMMLGTKFWRADDEFTRAQPGTGLGFAITRRLIEQMGGKIRVESERGTGSTFAFRIPFRAAGT